MGEPEGHPVPSLPIEDQPWLLDSRQVARLLGISRTKAFQMMAHGHLPTVHLGRCARVPREALMIWIDSQTRPSGPFARGR